MLFPYPQTKEKQISVETYFFCFEHDTKLENLVKTFDAVSTEIY